jgi:hypothetical protein
VIEELMEPIARSSLDVKRGSSMRRTEEIEIELNDGVDSMRATI